MKEVDSKVAKILSLVLNRSVDLNADLKIGSPPEWDSLNQIEIVLLIEEEFSLQIPPEQIAQLVSQKEIVKYLSK